MSPIRCRTRRSIAVFFIQARGAFKKELSQHLRSKRTIRRSRHATQKGRGGGQIRDLISIRERPAAVEDRAVPGHWEGDLLAGSNNSCIATLVERHSRYVMLAKVPNKETETVVSALIDHARQLPTELYKSLTWDRGLEMADHKRFTLATDIAVYFCDPKSPWQRGSNENTNGLLRHYFPKGTDLSLHSQQHLDKIVRKLNERPRQTLEFETPAERFSACVAATGCRQRPRSRGLLGRPADGCDRPRLPNPRFQREHSLVDDLITALRHITAHRAQLSF